MYAAIGIYLMEQRIFVRGRKRLHGSVDISGSKNAALPILFATVLANDICIIENVPDIQDVRLALQILEAMGAKVDKIGETVVRIDTGGVVCGKAPYELVNRMRASTYILGAELGRFGHANVGRPGGCDFGNRPIDLHEKAFRELGATVSKANGCIDLQAPPEGLRGSFILFNTVSVGATINAILAAVTAEGETVIDNAAHEPHVVAVANFLNSCGANIRDAGTNRIRIRGVKELHGCTYEVIPDMIEAGTFMIAALATGGDVEIRNVIPKHLESITEKLREMGGDVRVNEDNETLHVCSTGELRATNFITQPYPGFPTDMHPQVSALLCVAKGTGRVTEMIFENRFRYVEELRAMGANVLVEGKTAVIGGGALSGAPVTAVDLRAGAAMVIAGLAAEGQTVIRGVEYIARGYDDIVGKLRRLGADICITEE